jgi:hypothetical protein
MVLTHVNSSYLRNLFERR